MVRDVAESNLTWAWDTPIPRIHVPGTPFEYPLSDPRSEIWGKEVTLVFNWCIMPVVGPVWRSKQPGPPFKFPKSWQEISK
mmetsp:Transcript_64344/g.152258  ORF Transcript_64344/g.152258 Transcript_64344/m.152258 type:complete len:81 (-) Transcript_64344:23-265(-)